mmetsp:Transcript_50737/g.93869  ORF Transcript_50737/g.93869 Transcript_50737/m.93869 type:complete len:249 (+) Transcript_50737:28-774(+)
MGRKAKGHDVHRKEAVRAKFRELDRNGDGILSFEELIGLLRVGSPGLADDELAMIFQGMDKDHSDSVDFDEFLDFVFSAGASIKSEIDTKAREVKATKKAEAARRRESERAEEEARLIARQELTAPYRRASSDARGVHDRLGNITGDWDFEVSGSVGRATFREANLLVLQGREHGWTYTLTMLEEMNGKKRADKHETGVWEVSDKNNELLLHSRTGIPPTRHLPLEGSKGCISGIQLQTSQLVVLEKR